MGWSAYGLSRAHRYHLELSWTELWMQATWHTHGRNAQHLPADGGKTCVVRRLTLVVWGKVVMVMQDQLIPQVCKLDMKMCVICVIYYYLLFMKQSSDSLASSLLPVVMAFCLASQIDCTCSLVVMVFHLPSQIDCTSSQQQWFELIILICAQQDWPIVNNKIAPVCEQIWINSY